jgi:predicted nuclease of restriction endonuclease-like RecB superfamily
LFFCDESEVLDLGKIAFIFDCMLISPNNEKSIQAFQTFWTPKSLQKRPDEFRSINFNRFIIAASREE